MSKHSRESCFAVAKQYDTKRDFRANHAAEYEWLRRNNLYEEACAHMGKLKRELTDDGIKETALQYQNRRAFKLGDQSSYNAAKKRGILDSVCVHMKVMWRKHTDEQLAAIAGKYATRLEFLEADNGAYQTADKRGILDRVCAHMDGKGTRRLDESELLEIAKRYETRMDLKIGDFGAYTTIIRRGLTQTAFAHMRHGNLCFREDKPAVVYQFRLDLPCGMVLYKVGISNRDPLQRLKSMEVRTDITVELIKSISYEHGRDARLAEKRLHRKFASHRYSGEPVMKNGNTELFMVPLITD